MSSTLSQDSGVKARNTTTACRKCHSRKVKCSGGWPCTNCRRANQGAECTYPSRTRQVKVSQSYIDQLLEEIQRLRAVTHAPEPRAAPNASSETDAIAEPSQAVSDADVIADSLRTAHAPAVDAGPPRPSTEAGDTARNPLLEDRPWFFPLTPEMPVLIGEANDAAFATRFRQALSGKSQSHIPRTHHAHDETIASLSQSDCPWPSPARARFLVKVSLNTICRRYFLVRKSTTLELLEKAIRNPTMCDTLSACKLFALFALGEAYSTRAASSESSFPGIGYYSNATRMLPVLNEQPRIVCVEVMVMLSLYSLTMNRRHAAYCMAGCAVRFAILMGLHVNITQAQLPNRDLREHRNRVWWTVYILDRTWSSMIGQPVSIRDEDIDVDLPSNQGLSESAAEDFAFPEYLNATLQIANLAAQISASIYGRRMQRGSFSHRVQQALQDLGSWVQELPSHLCIAMEEITPNGAMPIIILHLYFNQCLMLATRPILLHVLCMRRDSLSASVVEESSRITETALALSEACIRCARHSYRLLTDSWINGSFPTFDYTYTQYLFSCSIILAISSLSHTKESESDGDDFEAAAEILKQLDQNGSFTAKEFSKQIEAMKIALESISSEQNHPGRNNQGPILTASQAMPLPLQHVRPPSEGTTERAWMNLAEPSLQELLSQPDLDLRFLEPSIIDDSFQTFFWPEGGNEGWMND